LGPKGDRTSNEPSGDVAVKSDSTGPSPADSPAGSSSASEQKTDHPLRPANEPAMLTVGWPSPAVAAPTQGVASAPPAAFGRYQVREAIGAGGFGTVYRGHDTQLDRPVAIKVHRGSAHVPHAGADRFLEEARRLARLSHTGIVTVHDVGLHEGQVYIVSEYLEGPDLAEWLKHNSPSWHEAARIAAAVADALAHAHARLTVHRDVKPSNIILTPDRGPVLVDFGLALDDASSGGRELGAVSGTPAYMAPEQVAGVAHRIDGRTDVYSLGVVLYQMICGLVPFRASEIRELLRQVRDDEPQPPRQLVREIPPELERVCLKALAKRLQDRYTTAADFAEDLRQVSQSAAGAAALPSSRQLPVAEPTSKRLTNWPLSTQGTVSSSTSQRRTREAERRQVTVLVCGCELFEAEAYLEAVDAEDQAEVQRAYRHACEQAVRRFDGTVVECNDRTLLACFGFPVAHEDGAARAAQTGHGILADLKALAEQLRGAQKLELNPWVAIHTGPAVVEASSDAISVVGEARNVAVRLQDFAAAGEIICSEATHRLIRSQFNCLSLGHRKIKGMAQPVELFRVQEVGEARTAIEAARTAGLTPLTGRDHEMSLLKDRWEQAQEGMGQVVLLIGEAGLGKSRLVYALKQHVQAQAGGDAAAVASHPSSASAQAAQDSPVVEWRCSPHFQNSGLFPAADFFERFLGFGRDDVLTSRFDRLVSHLAEYDLDQPDVVPLFASLLCLPPDDRFPPLGLSPVKEREATFRALREWLRAYSGRRPVLFIVEDLHWVDASSLEFLGQFLAEGLHDRVLTLLTFRPEFQTPWPAVAHQTSLALNRLTKRQVGDLMRNKTGGTVPAALIEQICDRSSGVPLFVEEFTKMVQESGMLDEAGEGRTQASALSAREIPDTLQDLVTARLDRMEGDPEVANLAAVLGREFSYEMLAAAAAQDEPALQAELAKLVQAEILYPKGRPPRCTYIFKHALLEDALYNALVKGKRQQFHRRIALAMETSFPQTALTQPELLAYHFTEAGLTEQAIGYWLKAGLRSRERSAEIEAISHLSRGLALLGTLAESPGRDARELELLSPLGTAYIAARGYAAPEVGPAFRRARELCERVGQPLELFAIILGIWEWHTVRGDLRLCMDLAAEGMEFAKKINDPGIMMEALFMAGETMLYRADFAGARDHFGRAVAEYDDRERTRFWSIRTGHDAGVTCRSNLAIALWHLGYPDQARKVNREMIQVAREIGQPFSLAYALHHTCWLYGYCRLGSEVEAAAGEQIAIATEQGFALWNASGTFFKGAGMLLRGATEEALPLLLKGLALFRASGAELTLPLQLSTVGLAYLQSGRFDDARQAIEQGLAISEKNDERCREAELYRLKGELLLAESPDQIAAALDCFQEAIGMARRQESKAWELRATMSLARLWHSQGRRDLARQELKAVFDRYTEGFTMPDLVEAKGLLESWS
jgi:class 3 adenylate cyclase/predicted ATPase